jgi:cobalt-zinc-cadmium efflux system outer membrane protein
MSSWRQVARTRLSARFPHPVEASLLLHRVVLLLPLLAMPLAAQRPLSRADAIATALVANPRLAAARADTTAARARGITARSVPDPTLAASYTKSTPQYHVTAEMPLDELWLRGLRVHAAEVDQLAARLRERYERAAVSLAVDTSYTRALAAQAHAALSTRNAQDADSLLHLARVRMAAGDASELEVELATLTAGQQDNAAAADSVSAATTLLELQSLLGLSTDRVTVALSDSLARPAQGEPDSLVTSPLLVASSEAALQSATLTLRLQHRSVWGSPGVIVGFETGDPTGAEPGLLPTVGLSLPLPIFNRNRGPVAEAEAERDRAAAEVQVVTVESRTQLAVARAEWRAASSRLGRDASLVQRADRVAALAVTAYTEGASPLANVLGAQRSARDVRSQYIDDMANLLIAGATLRLFTLTTATESP